MVYLLIPSHLLIESHFETASDPHNSPIALFLIFYFSKSIIFKRISDNFRLRVQELKVITPIRWHVGSNRHGIFISSEDKRSFLGLHFLLFLHLELFILGKKFAIVFLGLFDCLFLYHYVSGFFFLLRRSVFFS